MWLKDDQGQERFYKLAGFELPALEGHQVAIVFGAPAGSSDANIFGAMNHTSGDVVCDVMVLNKALRPWKLQIGEGRSLLAWTFVPALALGLLAFVGDGGRFDHRMGSAVLCAIGGWIAGPIAWMVLGFNLGPRARLNHLTSQINQLGRAQLAAAGGHPVS